MTEKKIESDNPPRLFDNSAFFSGTQVNYFFVCKTKLWLFSHFVRLEQRHDVVKLGKILHEESFKREKEAQIDSKIAIDFVRKKDVLELHEVKKTPALGESHVRQLQYYLYYLKKVKGIEKARGVLNYPTIKKVVEVSLSEEDEKEMEKTLGEIKEILALPKPPEKEKKPFCRKCSYFEFCWGE